MKLLYNEIDKRLDVTLNKKIKGDTASGIMKFGDDNLYPQIMESLILGSQTGKASSSIFAKFIAGSKFSNPEIGKIVVGKDNKGKPITLDKMRRQIANSIAINNGFYIHSNITLSGVITDTNLVPFKNCRFSIEDDLGNCGLIAYHKDWASKKIDNKDIVWFNTFNTDTNVIKYQVDKSEGSYNGQMYFSFIDESFLYPLSEFDSVYLELDTEYQIQLYKNRELRNGFSKKVVFNMELEDDEETQKLALDKLNNFMGPDGDKVLLINSKFGEDGNILDKSYKIEEIASTIDKDLFQNAWNKDTTNAIRKAAKALPAVLIDYEQGTLSQASGEMLVQAFNYYNMMTADIRVSVSESLREIYSNFDNDILANNTDWSINEVQIGEAVIDNSAENSRIEAQNVLKGSVGGVTSLIALQQSVSEGKTDLSSAVEIVKEIFGISEEIATKMIGTPKVVIPTQTPTGDTQ